MLSPELSLRAILLGIMLSVVLAAANAYLGLFAGMTVSASIPAAVLSMALLRRFRNSSILENNSVQTAASAGEAVAAGAIFTLPALLLMGAWDSFEYWPTTLVVLSGGLLGVFFSIPLRRALVVEEKLRFPEGVATAHVLQSGEKGAEGARPLILGGAIGAVVKLCESGLSLWQGVFETATLVGGRFFCFFGMNLSPALLGVGYIVGLNIAALVFIGGAISWWGAIPILVLMDGVPAGEHPVAYAYQLWSSKIRFLGVGAMVVGGLWALLRLLPSLFKVLRLGVQGVSHYDEGAIPEHERDLSPHWIALGVLVLLIPIYLIYSEQVAAPLIALVLTACMLVAGFLFSAVTGYMAGLVGSSNNPVSGTTIATILLSALLLLLLLPAGHESGPAAAILVGAVVCCAAAISGDNMQDLKSGNILGATPWKQQVMQLVGATAGALVISPVLTLLASAYGFGPQTEMQPNALAAPQATLMQSVAEGVFGWNLPVTMVSIGALLAVVIILIDRTLERRGSSFRMPVLAVAVGLYLPFELCSTIFLGGLCHYFVSRRAESTGELVQRGTLFCAGLIAGEALLGILLALWLFY